MRHPLAPVVVVMLCVCSLLATAGQPNIVVILTDDQGYGDIRSHGNDRIETPNLDKLAAAGARFEQFYVSPVCSPTRASFLTGRYHERLGVSGTSRGEETMRLGETTIAEVFQQAGYATGCFGKWHNGVHYPYHPNGRGFDEFFGFCLGHWNNYFDTPLEHNGKPVRTKGYINDVITDAALEWMRTQQDTPFFCYIPYNTPHTPHQVPDRYFDAYKAHGLTDELASIYGMCANLDDNIGRILAHLDTHGKSENTIVVFFGDNGANTERYNAGMRGRKGSVHEGGVRNACFIRWPRGIAAGTSVKPIAAHIDLLPTLTDLAGIPLQTTHPVDGLSLVPLFSDTRKDAWPGRYLFSHWKGRGAVRTPQYRLVLERGAPQLYDMVADPGEKTTIAEQQPEILEELKSAYDAWYAEVTKDGFEVPPIPIGYPEQKKIIMTCSEADWGGDLEWGGKFPNNNWVTQWTNLADTITWKVDVVRGGTYAVTLEYICPEGDLGSRVRVATSTSRVEGIVDVAAAPNYVPSPDRVPRKEVYERIWGYLPLGELELTPGRDHITIRALSKSGEMVMDLKSVQLEYLE